MELILRLSPWEYAHVLNEDDNIIQLFCGPVTHTLANNESIVKPVTKLHVIPQGSYCVVVNPHAQKVNADGVSVPHVDQNGQVVIRSGEKEVRYNTEPFPLYPEEEIEVICELPRLMSSEYLVLRVESKFTEDDGTVRREGDRIVWKGPGTYYPRVELSIVEQKSAIIVKQNEGLHCKAVEDFVDADGVARSTGEEYLYLRVGEHFLHPKEVFVSIEPAIILDGEGVHLIVLKEYVDPRPFAQGKRRTPGDVFLVSGEDTYALVPHPYEAVARKVKRITVSPFQFCMIKETNNRSLAYSLPKHLGAKRKVTQEVELSTGTVIVNSKFYLQPWQVLTIPPRDVYLLGGDEALLLRATEEHTDTTVTGEKIKRERGDQWLVCGPCRYIPTPYVIVVDDPYTKNEKRVKELIGEGEGIYVRHTLTGEVRAVMGPCSYMLDAYEELWEKQLTPDIEMNLLRQFNSHASYMDSTSSEQLKGKTSRAVVYRIPHRSVTQLFNYKTQTHRVLFGPDRVALQPDEEFTVISLSGSPWDPKKPQKCLPKEPNRIKSLNLFLGPSNMTDLVYVETRDHAQLGLQLCYDWYFDIKHGDYAAATRCFSVNDFVGDCCSFIASRIRSAVASLPFEEFHTQSARCLKQAVFGLTENGSIATELRFHENNLVITSVDTQELEVLDQRTRVGLQKSVKMAIELTTHAQEASAMLVATAREQEAKGKLDRQAMVDQVENEKQRKVLLEAESKGLEIINSGKSKATAGALSTAADIDGKASVNAAEMQCKSDAVLRDAHLTIQRRKKDLSMKKERKLQDLQSEFNQRMSDVQHFLMAKAIAALGPSTIEEIARSGPELQANLLSSLGLEGYLMTDGSSPVNLFQTAAGLSGAA